MLIKRLPRNDLLVFLEGLQNGEKTQSVNVLTEWVLRMVSNSCII